MVAHSYSSHYHKLRNCGRASTDALMMPVGDSDPAISSDVAAVLTELCACCREAKARHADGADFVRALSGKAPHHSLAG